MSFNSYTFHFLTNILFILLPAFSAYLAPMYVVLEVLLLLPLSIAYGQLLFSIVNEQGAVISNKTAPFYSILAWSPNQVERDLVVSVYVKYLCLNASYTIYACAYVLMGLFFICMSLNILMRVRNMNIGTCT
jgi:hypothetical protein